MLVQEYLDECIPKEGKAEKNAMAHEAVDGQVGEKYGEAVIEASQDEDRVEPPRGSQQQEVHTLPPRESLIGPAPGDRQFVDVHDHHRLKEVQQVEDHLRALYLSQEEITKMFLPWSVSLKRSEKT
jgi:hypothetical protein